MNVEPIRPEPIQPPLEAVRITLTPDQAVVLMAVIGDRPLQSYTYNGVSIQGLFTALADTLVDSGYLSEPYRESPNPEAPDLYEATEQIMRSRV